MKKFFLISLCAASCCFSLAAEEETSNPKQKLIDEVLTDYQEGRYKKFLKSIDSSYKNASKKWEHNSALEERKKLSELVTDYHKEPTELFKKEITALHESQNRELIEVCVNHPNERISREVRDMIFFTPSPHEQQSLDYLHEIGHKFKGDGTTPLENKLIQIDTEFWLKGLSLGTTLSQGKIDQETFHKQYLVLQVEKLKQMQEACTGDLVDVKIKGYIDTASQVLPKVNASTVTKQYLTALGREKAAPKNGAEREMQKIMAQYLEKEEALIEKHFSNPSS